MPLTLQQQYDDALEQIDNIKNTPWFKDYVALCKKRDALKERLDADNYKRLCSDFCDQLEPVINTLLAKAKIILPFNGFITEFDWDSEAIGVGDIALEPLATLINNYTLKTDDHIYCGNIVIKIDGFNIEIGEQGDYDEPWIDERIVEFSYKHGILNRGDFDIVTCRDGYGFLSKITQYK